MKISLNDPVRVRLNAWGHSICRQAHQDFFKGKPIYAYKPPEEDAQGWSTWNLWELMEMFGSSLHHGGPVPFDKDLEIEESDKPVKSEALTGPDLIGKELKKGGKKA